MSSLNLVREPVRRRRRRMRLPGGALWALAFAIAASLGCAAKPPPRPPQVDPTEQWVRAGRKVDFAIGETKSMIQRARGASYLPDLHMRLAELYTERARYAWLIVYERRHAKGDSSRAVEAPEAALLKNIAVSIYTRILREFPTYERADEALFLMAHEYRELGDFDAMLATYERLVQSYPRSSHRMEAYLALGDHAFDANDLAKAERYYNQILSSPVSPVHSLARYKLAWVRVNQQDCPNAVRLFETVLHDAQSAPTRAAQEATLLRAQKNLNVVHEALVDLAYCYPEVYPDKPAVPYFRGLASSSLDYLAAMRRLANRFVVKELYAQAVTAMREVIDGAVGDDDSVDMMRRLHTTIIRGSVFDHPSEDVERIVRVLDARLGDYRLAGPARDRLLDEAEVYARDVATRAHAAAKDSPNTALLSRVADAYGAYLGRFDKANARADVQQNHAEVLLAAKRYYDAGRAYEAVEASASKPDVRRQARLNAIAAYQQALESRALGRLPRALSWGGIRALGRRVIADSPNEPANVGIKLSIARSYYESGEYERAAQLFYAVAKQYPTTNEAIAASHLALDALRLADDPAGLATLGHRILADTRIGNDDFRKEIREIVEKTAQRQVAEVTAMDTGDREERLLAMAKRNKGSEVGEQAFYNMLLVAKSTGAIDRFYELGDQYLADYPTSPRRVDVLSALASVASDIGEFRKAAQYLSLAYAADAQGKGSEERLFTAASIRSVLGEPAASTDVRKLAERGSTRVDELLVMLARSGNMSTLQEALGGASINSGSAAFFRGYLAYQRGDHAEAARVFSTLPTVSSDLRGRARFLMGEIAYSSFRNAETSGNIASTIDAKVKLLGAVEKAFLPVVEGQDARWAMAGLARVADGHAKYADFLRALEVPADLKPDERKQLKDAIDAQAAAEDKKAADLRGICSKKAKSAEVFSEAARSCLRSEPLPDAITMYPETKARGGGETAGGAAVRKDLLKNPKDVDALTKLAEMHLGAGDVGIALLLLERAEDIAPRKSAILNLKGIALHRLGEAQDAKKAFEAAVAADPNDRKAHANLAAHCAFFGHKDRALAELERAGGVPATVGGASDHPELAILSKLEVDRKGGKK